MATPTNATKLNEVQLHLLTMLSKMFETDLADLKQVLVEFYYNKAQQEGDKIWQEKGLNEKAMEDLLASHPKRTPYKNKQ